MKNLIILAKVRDLLNEMENIESFLYLFSCLFLFICISCIYLIPKGILFYFYLYYIYLFVYFFKVILYLILNIEINLQIIYSS